MPLGCKGLQRVKENEKTLLRQKGNKKVQDSGRQKMVIGVAFKLLKIDGGRKVRNRKKVPQVRKETIRIEKLHLVSSIVKQ